jgi:hypothetical protein
MSVPVARNVAAQEIGIALLDGASIVTTPTIAAGDIQISIDFAAFENVTAAEDPAGSGQVKLSPTQAQTNGVHLGIRWIDQAGAEWGDGYYSIFTETTTIGTIGTVLTAITATLAAILTAVQGVCSCVINGLLNVSPIRRAIRSVDLELYRGDTWVQPIARLGDISAATDIWFTAKRDKDNTDAEADILISETVGLEVINQVAATVAGNGSITVTDATVGNITVRLEAVETAKLTDKKSHWYYDVQWTDGTDVESPRTGRLTVTGDVTRTVT